MTTNVTLACPTCGRTARRALLEEPGCRGTHETKAVRATCPEHGVEMVRLDAPGRDGGTGR